MIDEPESRQADIDAVTAFREQWNLPGIVDVTSDQENGGRVIYFFIFG